MPDSLLHLRRELQRGELLGRYEIVGPIGSGGFGRVYRAWDPQIRRPVALKTCETGKESIRRRFAREARLAGGLDHPNIVRIFDFQEENGLPFMVQEFLAGEDLERRLSHAQPLPLEEKYRILGETGNGLAHAHAQGIVHRDIKPGNILLATGGGVKILDFGIAKAADSGPTMTRPGTTLGSLGYMAPEQIEGKRVDPRTDLFALGVVAYELFAGHRPFEGKGLGELFDRILREQPDPLSGFVLEIPVELDALILRCLEKEAARRPASAEDFVRELGFARGH